MQILGMMSGTSLDGVDAAVLDTDGEAIFGFGRSGYRAYGGNESAVLHAALGQWPGGPDVAAAAALTEEAHAALAADFPEAEAIAFHGQTLAHDPGGRGTHQAGQGWRLARRTGRPVIWDFRSEDVRQGGQGAPLVPFFHHALARWAVAEGRVEAAPMAFLNLGGVGNVSWVDPRVADPAAPGACLACDSGPANAPINDLMRARRGAGMDAGGALAARGEADAAVVAQVLAHPFFAAPLPKSLDRDSFAGLAAAVAHLGDADACATLTAVVAESVARAVALMPAPPAVLWVCGGGRHNAAMMAALARALDGGPAPVPVEALGLDGDMIEAQAFAYLGARVWRGLPISAPLTTGAAAPVCGGRISAPGG